MTKPLSLSFVGMITASEWPKNSVAVAGLGIQSLAPKAFPTRVWFVRNCETVRGSLNSGAKWNVNIACANTNAHAHALAHTYTHTHAHTNSDCTQIAPLYRVRVLERLQCVAKPQEDGGRGGVGRAGREGLGRAVARGD